MLTWVRLVLSLAILVLLFYNIIANDANVLHYVLLLWGTMLLVAGIDALRDDKKIIGYVSLTFSVFPFFAVFSMQW